MAFLEPEDSVQYEPFSAGNPQPEIMRNDPMEEKPGTASTPEDVNRQPQDAHPEQNTPPEKTPSDQESSPQSAGETVSAPLHEDFPHDVKEHDDFEPTLASDLNAENAEEGQGTDYFKMTKEELIIALESLLTNRPLQQIGDEADIIKINFYKKHKAEIERKRRKFIDDGGNLEDFKPGEDPLENQFKELFKK